MRFLYFSALLLTAIGPILGQTPCSNRNALRLDPATTFTSTSAGRLEICYCTNNICTWSTISTGSETTPWSWKNVQVACRQLARNTSAPFSGLGHPIISTFISEEDYASSLVNVHPSSFSCDGTESDLASCTTSPLGASFLDDHSNDVFISCSEKAPVTSNIRLTGSLQRNEGVLEMYLNVTGRWETVCSSTFGVNEATVVCKTLGYASGTPLSFTTNAFRGNQINISPAISGISCMGTEKEVDSCFISRGSCSSNTIAGVRCIPSVVPEGNVRLATLTAFHTYNRVEVLYAGRWGTVCNRGWDSLEGMVACRELSLGIDEAEVPSNTEEFFPILNSQRPIWISSYMCAGPENNLTACNQSLPTGYTPSCTHLEDAGLLCGEVRGGGLSGGAIAGIVLGVLIPIIICCVICAIVIVKWLDIDIECDCCSSFDCDCCKRSRRRRRRSFDLTTTSSSPTRETSSYDQTTERTEEEILEEELKHAPKDPEFTKEAPPSYIAAKSLNNSDPPPNPDTSDPPPYPDTSDPPPYPDISDPAYPKLINSTAV